MLYPSDISESDITGVLHRTDELKNLNDPTRNSRGRIRRILNGGREGIAELVNKSLNNDEDLPAANHLLDAVRSLGQKLGIMPDTKVDPPIDKDSDRAKKRAEKRARIVTDFDQACKLELQMPQSGRWLPGYGFTPWVIRVRKKHNGDPYPHASVRDPYNAYPAPWGVDQQPMDIAFSTRVDPSKLAKKYPRFRKEYSRQAPKGQNGAVLLDQIGRIWSDDASTGAWAHQGLTSHGVELIEYYNDDGCWWLVPETKQLLEFVPNPIESGPPFYVMKRFAFDKLIGQYDHAIGLMAAIARLNMLSIMATEDAVFAETNVAGEMLTGSYERGRKAVNFLMPNSSVQKMNDRVPFEVFQQIDRLEQQLRKVANHPMQQSGVAPTSWLTGEGLEKLGSSVDAEVSEYQTIIRWGLQALDAKRLEFMEKLYPNRQIEMTGVRQGAPYSDTYKPRVHINKDYQTRRVYGVMAGWDEPTKIVGGLNLLQARVIDRDTLRENISGLEDHLKIAKRVRNEQIENVLFDALAQRAAAAEDPAAMEALIGLLPDGEDKDILKEVLMPEEEPQPQQPQLGPGQGQQPELPPGGELPNTQTVLNRLTNNSRPTQGVQTVGQTGG